MFLGRIIIDSTISFSIKRLRISYSSFPAVPADSAPFANSTTPTPFCPSLDSVFRSQP